MAVPLVRVSSRRREDQAPASRAGAADHRPRQRAAGPRAHSPASWLAVGASLTGCALLAACGGTASPGAAPTRTVTVHASSPASAPPASPAAGPTSASPAARRPAGCLASGLRGTLGAAQGAAGTFYQVVVLTNTSGATCTLYGYAGVSFVTGVGGQQIGAAATRDPAVPATLVTVPPGGQASMLIARHDAGAYSPSQCDLTSVEWLRVYPPGDYGSLLIHYPAQTCARQALAIMTVTAVRADAGSASA